MEEARWEVIENSDDSGERMRDMIDNDKRVKICIMFMSLLPAIIVLLVISCCLSSRV